MHCHPPAAIGEATPGTNDAGEFAESLGTNFGPSVKERDASREQRKGVAAPRAIREISPKLMTETLFWGKSLDILPRVFPKIPQIVADYAHDQPISREQ